MLSLTVGASICALRLFSILRCLLQSTSALETAKTLSDGKSKDPFVQRVWRQWGWGQRLEEGPGWVEWSGRQTSNQLVFSAYDVCCRGGSAPRLSESTNTARHPLSQAQSALCQPGPASFTITHTHTHKEDGKNPVRVDMHSGGGGWGQDQKNRTKSCHAATFPNWHVLLTRRRPNSAHALLLVMRGEAVEEEEEERVKNKDLVSRCKSAVSTEQRDQLSP